MRTSLIAVHSGRATAHIESLVSTPRSSRPERSRKSRCGAWRKLVLKRSRLSLNDLSKFSPKGVIRIRESNPQKAMEALSGLVFRKSLWLISYEPYMAHETLKNRLKPAPVLGQRMVAPVMVTCNDTYPYSARRKNGTC